MDADKRRFIAWAYIAYGKLLLYAAQRKNQEASLQSAPSPQREGGAVSENGTKKKLN